VGRVVGHVSISAAIVALLLAVVLPRAAGALAQGPPGQGQPADGGATTDGQPAVSSGTAPRPAAQPDISFTATIHMDNLRFGVVPQPTIQVSVQPSGQPIVDVQTQNLPAVVQPNVDYPNVTVRLTISGTLADPASAPAQAPATPAPTPSP
jgi:hypothetical protein